MPHMKVTKFAIVLAVVLFVFNLIVTAQCVASTNFGMNYLQKATATNRSMIPTSCDTNKTFSSYQKNKKTQRPLVRQTKKQKLIT